MGVGGNLKTVGKQNTENVIKLLMVEKSLSRRELADRLGVSKMTITNIVTRLKEEGYLCESRTEKNASVNGPTPTAVSILPNRIIAVGVHITPKLITVQEVDVVAGVLYESQAAVDNIDSNQQMLKTIKEMLSMLFYERKEHRENIVGIGVSYNGTVDSRKGSIYFSVNRIEKEEIAIKKALEKMFDLPVAVYNETHGATIAELVFGERLGPDKMYYVNLGKSIRGEFAQDYLIQHGMHGGTGELGHLSIKYDGPKCKCGARGCYNLYGSTDVLLQKSHCYSIEELQIKLQARDALALRVMEEFIQISAFVFTNIVNMCAPKYLLIGGDIAKLDDSIFRKIEGLVNERTINRKERYVKIHRSSLNTKANILGASMVVFEEIFAFK